MCPQQLTRLFRAPVYSGLCALNGTTIQPSRLYARNPLERRTKEELMGGVSGGRGGRGGRGRKKGGKKGLRQTAAVALGEGVGGVRWAGLSHPLLTERKSSSTRTDWLQREQLGIKKAKEEGEKDDVMENQINWWDLEGDKRVQRRVSEIGWSIKGWSGKRWGGRDVGCPETPDGTPLTDFKSVVIELKHVSNQTKGGKKRSVSALIVVGNGNGAAGFAVGKGEETRSAIRKAKNKAANCLHYIPRCDGHTIYHNIQTKACCTNILFERRVRGSGLRCQRAVAAICKLAGVKDIRAKIIGSTNPLNIVRAAFKGLSSQETHRDLANRTGLFLVEYRRECYDRPIVVGVPDSKNNAQTTEMLESLHLLPKTTESQSVHSTVE